MISADKLRSRKALLLAVALTGFFGFNGVFLYYTLLEPSMLAGALANPVAAASEALALAVELGERRVLMDERKGRRKARSLGLGVTGVLGILLWAAETLPEREAAPRATCAARRTLSSCGASRGSGAL